VREAGHERARSEGLVAGGRVLFTGLLGTSTVLLAAELALSGAITVGTLVAAYGYAVFLGTPIRWMLTTNQQWAAGKVCAERVGEYLQTQPWQPLGGSDSRDEESREEVAGPAPCLLEASGYTVVTAVSATDWNAVAARLRRWIEDPHDTLLVPSDDYLFSGPLAEVVDPRNKMTEEGRGTALSTSAFAAVVQALAEGTQHRVTAGAADFSGGEQQRLRLARALVADPDTLILVEPTNALDSTTEVEVATRLRAHRQGKRTVVLTNSVPHLSVADQVVLLDDGEVLATGGHAELLERADYRAMVQREEVEA
jgi:ABC-type multidrug transport system fused ATPase/permease subunit